MLVGFSDWCFRVIRSLSSQFGYECPILAFLLKPFVKGSTIQLAVLMTLASQIVFLKSGCLLFPLPLTLLPRMGLALLTLPC